MDVEGKQIDLQTKQLELQGKQQIMQMQAEGKMVDALVAQQKARIEIESKQRAAEIDAAMGMQSLQTEATKQEIGISGALAQLGMKIGQQAAQPKKKPNSGRKK